MSSTSSQADGERQDAIHQVNVKRGITSHFARTLKVLQQRHMQSDGEEFIYSDDFSNNLCNALEAVFLHGLKDSVAQKLTAYVGLAQAQDQSFGLNFWSIAANFTHKDVVNQLRSLTQINTDIGLCRAWVRLALNDGLMESYLHSMVVDTKTLQYYYHSFSYLRDHEQPGILQNYLTGLMSLRFQLSHNSSVLNSWNNSTLQLVGILETHATLSPVVGEGGGTRSENSVLKLQSRRSSKDRIASRQNVDFDEPIVLAPKLAGSKVGYNEPSIEDHMFSSINDVEEIRRLGAAKASHSQHSFTPSEGSTSSRVSCPDPGMAIQESGSELIGPEDGHIVSPALYPRPDIDKEDVLIADRFSNESIESVVKKSEVPSVEQSSEALAEIRGQEDRGIKILSTSPVIIDDSPFDISSSPRRPRSRRIGEEDFRSKGFSPCLSPLTRIEEDPPMSSEDLLDLQEDGQSFSFSPPSVALQRQSVVPTPSSTTNKTPVPTDHSSVSGSKSGQMRSYDEICANLPPVQLDPLEQAAILKKVLKEIDRKADHEREARHSLMLESGLTPDAVLHSAGVKKSSRDTLGLETTITRDPGVAGLSFRVDGAQPVQAESKLTEGEHRFGSVGQTLSIQDEMNAAEAKSGPSFNKSKGSSESKETLEADTRDINVSEEQSNSQDGTGNEEIEDKNPEPREEQRLNPNKVREGGAQGNSSQVYVSPAEEDASSIYKASKEEESSELLSGNYGNSLGSMTGWSSQLEAKKVESRRTEVIKSRGESFASMLRAYTPAWVQPNSLEQVLEGLPSEGEGNRATDEPDGNQEDLIERQDSALEDFEIVDSPRGSVAEIDDADSSRMIFLYRVPREHGLSHQNFTCRGCSRPIGIIYGQPRLCEFDGGLYCYECHENNETYIPSSIVFDWDFRKKKVCVENYRFLQNLEDQPLFEVEKLNPKLYAHVPQLSELKVLRQQLCYLKSYLFACSQKVAESLRQKVWPREHLYDRQDLFSVTDLLQVQQGTLTKCVKELVKFSSRHVYECLLCCQKGFICEICRNPKVIFPFELETTIRCSVCKAVYHKTCMTESLPCPKCERWGRKINNSADSYDSSHPEDYGVSPPL